MMKVSMDLPNFAFESLEYIKNMMKLMEIKLSDIQDFWLGIRGLLDLEDN